MKTSTKTAFEAVVDQVREAQSKASRGYGSTLVYASDALEDTNTDFDLALDHARALLQLRKRQVEDLEAWLTVLDTTIANGGREEYIAEIERIYSK